MSSIGTHDDLSLHEVGVVNRLTASDHESPHFLQDLTSQQLDCAVRCLKMRIRTFQKSEVLLTCAGDSSTLGVMLAGIGHDVRMHINGERTLVDIIQAGDLFGDGWQSPRIASYNGPKERSIIAATSGSALYFAPAKLNDETVQCSALPIMRQKVWQSLQTKQERLHAKIEMLHHRSLRKRLGSYLLTEALRHQQTTFVLPISRTILAEYLHVDRAALSRELSSMRDDGLIDYWSQKCFQHSKPF